MKRSIKLLFSMLFVFSVFTTGIQRVSSEIIGHQFSFIAYDCGEFDDEEMTCLGPDEDGETPEKDLTDVQPGDIIKLGVHYIPSDDPTDELPNGKTSGDPDGKPDALGFSLSVMFFYDPDVVTPIHEYDEGDDVGVYMPITGSTYAGGPYPAKGTSSTAKMQTNWTVTGSDVNNVISAVVKDSKGSGGKVLETEGDLYYVYFKVSDTASVGDSVSFDFDTSPGKTKMANNSKIHTEDLSFTIGGEFSANNTLGTLNVTNGSTTYPVTPTFEANNGEITTYTAVVPNHITSVDIAADPYDTNSTVSGTGTKNNLKIGDNSYNITVVPQSGESLIYTVKVRRLNNDARLSSLSLSGDINIGTFSDSKINYTASVPYSTSSTSVSASVYGVASGSCTECTAGDTAGKATIKSGTGSWSLTNTGATNKNTRTVVVQAENCKAEYSSVPGNSGACVEKTYTIEVTRADPSTDNKLSDLTIDGNTVTGFTPGTFTYDLGTVANSKTEVNIGATPNDSKASIISTLGNKSLVVGDNTLTVTVKAESGATQDYTVKIRRLSNDSSLSSMTVTSTPAGGSLSPTFSSGTTDFYTFTAPADCTKVTIAATPNHSSASVIAGTGDFTIEANPVVNVTVQAEDGSQTIYIVKLVRAKSDNNYLSDLTVDGTTVTGFDKTSTAEYTVNVSGTVTSVEIGGTVEDTGKAVIESGTGTVNLVKGDNHITVAVKAENGTYRYYKINVVKAAKTDALLTDLTVDGTTVTGFTPSTTEYTLPSVAYEKTSIIIGATLSDTDASVSGTGTIMLNTGDNKLYVTVTAEDGVTNTPYIINIERAKDSNNLLSDLTVDGTTITGFSPTQNSYSLTVPNNVTSLALVATPQSADASVLISGNSGFVTTGTNSVSITVTAEDGGTNIYTIDVTREKSENNFLQSITLSTGTVNETVDHTTTAYTATVGRTVSSVTVTATPEDSSATVVVNSPESFEVGDNLYTIVVTNEKGQDRNYTLTITRSKSSNKNLSDITIDGTTITGFVVGQTSYSISVPSNTTSVNVQGTVEDNLSTVSGGGDKNLTAGDNTVTLTVTAEDESTLDYVITINKALSNDSTLKALTVSETSLNETFVPADPTALIYTANVDYEVTSVNITATPNYPGATVVGDLNPSLNTGDNTIDIEVTAEDGTTKSTYKLTIHRTENDNAYLSGLSVTGGTLVPGFDKDIDNYTMHVTNNISQVQIIGTPEDPNASVSGDGLITLNTGDNNIKVTVTAENGSTKKDYNIKITRDQSSDTTLTKLIPSSGTLDPVFDPETPNYTLSVSNEVTAVTFTATPTSDAATVTVSSNASNLPVGDTTVTIDVLAEDGTLGGYSVVITRQPSSNNFLSGLSVKDSANNEYIPAASFNKSTLLYEIEVENGVDSVEITATPEDTSSTVSGDGSKTLNVGLNPFTITVLSQENIPRYYEVKITRKSSSNAYLSTLEVVGYTLTPGFDKETTGYTLTVPSNVNTVTVNATAEDANSTVTGTGENIPIATGTNNIVVDVTAPDTTTKSYTIVITKSASSNSRLSGLTISPGTLVPDFDADAETQNYTVNVDNSTSVVVIAATPEDSTSTVTGDGTKSLSTGDNDYEIVVTAEDGSSSTTYNIKVIREKSDNNYLSDLTIDGTTVTGFNRSNPSYTLSVDNSVKNVTIGATLEDVTATVGGTGNINLNTGENIISIPVTAENGDTRFYEIKITRAYSNNNLLKSLSAAEGTLSPDFDPAVNGYTISIPYENTSLTLSYEADDSAATVTVEQNENFVVGANTVLVNVEAEDGSLNTYTLTVTRQPEATNFLTGITVTDGDGVTYALDPVFDKKTYLYDVEIGGTVSNVTIAVDKQETTDVVAGDGLVAITSFPQTQNITVTTADGSATRTYKLTFIKGKSSNALLGNLSVDKGTLTPGFNSATTYYEVTVPSGTSTINVTATPAETAQTITGDGSHSLSEGANTIDVQVTAENGNVNTYTIVVTVASGPTSDNKLSSLSVDKGSLDPAFDPDVTSYTVNLETEESDITITATGDNNITGTGTMPLTVGVNTFTVTTEKDGETVDYIITVNNLNRHITSTIHTVGDTYISTILELKTSQDVKGEMTNPYAYLHIYDTSVSGTKREIAETEQVCNGYIIELEINGEVCDSKILIIKGDVNLNGEVEVADSLLVDRYILRNLSLTAIQLEAADVNEDGLVDVADSLLIDRHILKNYDIFTKEAR